MGLNINSLRQKQMSTGGTGWTPKPGPNRIFILPPTGRYFTEELDDFVETFNIHYFRMDGMDTQVSRCFRDRGDVCPVCQAVSIHKNDTDPGKKAMAEQLKRVERRLLNIVDLNDPTKGVQIYECGWGVYKDMLDIMADPNWGEPMNIQRGRAWTLTFTPSGQTRSGYNEYSCMPEPQEIEMASFLQQVDPQWQQKLDELSSGVSAYLEMGEIENLLNIVGLPMVSRSGGVQAVPAANVTVPGVPAPATPAAPPVAPAAPAAPGPLPSMATKGVSAGAAAMTSGPVPAAAPAAPAAPVAPGAPNPVPVAPGAVTVAEAAWPAGLEAIEMPGYGTVPVCFGDFDVARHPCNQCGFVPNCQPKTMGLV